MSDWPRSRRSRVDKPWGYELIWAETDTYVGKVLFVRAGQALSLQYHERKDESWLVQGGRAIARARAGGRRAGRDRGRPRETHSATAPGRCTA